MLRRLVIASLVTTAAGLGGAGGLGPLPGLPLLSPSAPDALTVTITKSGHRAADGSFTLECDGDRAGGGNHPAAERACARLDGYAKAGEDPFAPVAEDRLCSLQHGGPALAHITGQWQGRTVDARFSRAGGCEIERWTNLEPVLPHVR
ncbi:subtilase-type protease inhibitor [Streptomyces sp. Je 1-79]|uniref:subtilase-type protease inhibitor n=1 Tax=Streptomyces sp. Je 1-79 TaxID=2943847 RepID=UPI0021A70858|nr:subtilase-type protease inhibitor [Streptomyces sp. Je 1-79]MCT4357263.1 subtilase-type protease inhibitor [Streptomyces sp. Je 1-79]